MVRDVRPEVASGRYHGLCPLGSICFWRNRYGMLMPMLGERERFMLLNLIPGIGSLRLRRLLEAFGDLDRLWRSTAEELQQVEGIGPRLAHELVAGFRNEAALQQELAIAQRSGVAMLTLADPGYPKALRTIHDPPLALYLRGSLGLSDDVAVAIVGARRASLYGVQTAERLGYDLALRGVTVVSGLARGIDAAAHRGALRAAGRTIAVLGSGVARLYPPEHADLAEQIVQQGAVISEYPMEMPPLAQNFPRRNRVISGLSLGVVIVEAAQRSGALITADCALEQGREVFAVPGPVTSVTSQGTHQLLRQGARLVSSVEDIVEELRLSPCAPETSAPQPGSCEDVALSESEERLLACVGSEGRHVDVITTQSGLSASEASSLLLQLELKHVVQQLPGKQFIRQR